MLESQPLTILSYGPTSLVAEIFQIEFPNRFWIYIYLDVLTVLAYPTIGARQNDKLDFFRFERGLIGSR